MSRTSSPATLAKKEQHFSLPMAIYRAKWSQSQEVKQVRTVIWRLLWRSFLELLHWDVTAIGNNSFSVMNGAERRGWLDISRLSATAY